MARVLLILRVAQLLLALSNLTFASIVINWYLTRTRFFPPSSSTFLLFAPIFSLFSLLYLEVVARRAPRAIHPLSALAVESLNVIFYFCGFVAFAVFLSRLAFCTTYVCAAGRIVSVVAAVEFAAWSATAVLLAKDIFKGGLRKPAGTGTGTRTRTKTWTWRGDMRESRIGNAL